MYEIRTDLALEAHEINAQAGREDGIRTEEETIDGFSITTVHVGEGEGERLAKKKAGTYINVDVGKSWLLASEGFAALVALLAGQLRKLFPADFSGTALVVGLGNYDITGRLHRPKAVEKVVVTRHLRTLNPQLYESAGFGDLCAFAPGRLRADGDGKRRDRAPHRRSGAGRRSSSPSDAPRLGAGWRGWRRRYSSATRASTRARACPTGAASCPQRRWACR